MGQINPVLRESTGHGWNRKNVENKIQIFPPIGPGEEEEADNDERDSHQIWDLKPRAGKLITSPFSISLSLTHVVFLLVRELPLPIRRKVT